MDRESFQLRSNVCLQLLVFGDERMMRQMDGQQCRVLLDRFDHAFDLVDRLEHAREVEVEEACVLSNELLEVTQLLILVQGCHCYVQVLQVTILRQCLEECIDVRPSKQLVPAYVECLEEGR